MAAAEVWYVVDSAHGVRRSCGNCAVPKWDRAGVVYVCPYVKGKGRTLAIDSPCWHWKLKPGSNVLNRETGEVWKL